MYVIDIYENHFDSRVRTENGNVGVAKLFRIAKMTKLHKLWK